MIPLGYKITIFKGYAFSQAPLFNNYIYHFYELKKQAQNPADRYSAKLHLNTLYGIFGRSHNVLKTINVHTKDIPIYLTKYVVERIINIDKDKSVLLIQDNLETKILNQLKTQLDETYLPSEMRVSMDIAKAISSDYKTPVKANVAIAAAVTAYARIAMIPYKITPHVCYTDTDSIFTTQPLPEHQVGDALGQMKDELKGNIIQQAYFLGIKQYGYWLKDPQGQHQERSVFAGVPRNAVTWPEIQSLYQGGGQATITKQIPQVFHHNLSELKIEIHPTQLTLAFNPDKQLINNHYLPQTIYQLEHTHLAKQTLLQRTRNI